MVCSQERGWWLVDAKRFEARAKVAQGPFLSYGSVHCRNQVEGERIGCMTTERDSSIDSADWRKTYDWSVQTGSGGGMEVVDGERIRTVEDVASE